jgi:hypothetical protein
MGLLIFIQLRQDAKVLSTQTLSQRISGQSLTSIELILVWGVVGATLYQFARRQRRAQISKADAHAD